MSRPIYTSVGTVSVREEDGMMVFSLSNRLDGKVEFAVTPIIADQLAEGMAECRPKLTKTSGGRTRSPNGTMPKPISPPPAARRVDPYEPIG